MTSIDVQVTWSNVKLAFEKILSAQYLKQLFLDSYKIWKSGCPLIFMWSKVKVKLVIFILIVVYSISYDPLLDSHQTCYMLDDFSLKIIPIAFWVTR